MMKRSYQRSYLLLLGIVCILSVNQTAFGQDNTTESKDVSASAEDTKALKVGASLEVGTHALGGISAIVLYKERFGLRLGYNNMAINRNGLSVTYSGLDLSNDISVDRSHLFLGADIGLLATGAVRLVAGLGLMTKNQVSITSIVPGERNLNDLTITEEDIGSITSKISTSSNSNLYLGLGFGRAVPKGRIGFGFDIGAFYLGKYTLNMEATNLLRHNTVLQNQIEEDINTLKPWWPAVSFRVNVRIK